MIQFNKTFFQFTKRFALVVMLLTMPNIMWGHSLSNHYSQGNVSYTKDGALESPAQNIVYVATKDEKAPTAAESQIGFNKKQTSVTQSCNGSSSRDNQTYTFYAFDITKTAQNNDINDYLWGGWYKEGETDPLQDGSNSSANLYATNFYAWSQSITTTTTYKQDSNGQWVPDYTPLNLIAKWIVPKVIDVKIDNVQKTEHIISIDNPDEEAGNVNIQFSLSEARDKKNFNSSTDDNDNIQIEEDANNTISKENQSYKFIAKYQPTGIHGETSAEVTLTSNYDGEKDAPTSKTAKIILKENYTPIFTLGSYSHTFLDYDSYSPDNKFKVIPTNDICNHENTRWDVTWGGEDADYFELKEGSTPDNPIIHFKVKGTDENRKTEYKATLTIQAIYTDAKPKDVPSEQISITLTATFAPSIRFNGEKDYTTSIEGNAICEKSESLWSTNVEYIHNLNNTPTLTPSGHNQISFNNSGNNIEVSIRKDVMPGYYEAILTSQGVGEESSVTATLTACIDVELTTPRIKIVTPGNDDATIELAESIYGATHYIVTTAYYESDALVGKTKADLETMCLAFVEETPTNPSLKTITITKLSENTTYPTLYVTAVHIASGTVKDSKTSESVSLTTANYPTYITADGKLDGSVAADNIGIKTGTLGSSIEDELNRGFPIKAERNINVSAAFSGSEAKFHRLYIFGLTTNDGKDWKTPCYIYNREGNDRYKYDTQWIMSSRSDEDKNKAFFDITTDLSIYLTGYCPYATTGNNWTDNGVFYIKKNPTENSSDEINIYLDSLQIYAKTKSKLQNYVTGEDPLAGHFDGSFKMQGSGAIFVLDASEGNIKVNIHVRGNNIIKSTESMSLKLKGKLKGSNIDLTYKQYSPTIHMMVSGDNQYVELALDDIWHTIDKNNSSNYEHVNGKVRIVNYNNSNPLINLGFNNGAVRLNGGQIYFSNKTDISFALPTKKSTSEKSGYTTNYYGWSTKEGTGAEDHMPTSQPTIQFNDGTISAATSPLLCPTNTTIDGGSFICDITRNDANKNPLPIYSSSDSQKAHELHKISASIIESVGTIENGLAVFKTEQDGKDGFDVLMDNIFPHANCQSTIEGQNYYTSLSYYYPEVANYGHSSLAPQGTTVHLMLPRDGSVNGTNYKGWSFCAPQMHGTADLGGDISVTGNIEISSTVKDKVLVSEANEKLKVTNRLLYTEFDAITEAVLSESGRITIEDTPYEVTNEDVYTINEKTYMLLPIVAGQWRMVVPPFDVHNVYVIESYPEDQIKKDFGEEVRAGRWQIKGEPNITNARKAQSSRLIDLLAYWLAIENLDTDFFGASTGTYSFFVNEWIDYEKTRDKDGNLQESNENYTPTVEQLFHYTGDDGAYPDGKGWWDANYYLYKTNGVWTGYNSATNKFETDWEVVTAQSTQRGSGTPNVIMQRGGLYTMQFPAVVGTTAADWNYWTGKYILLEGYGPQTIYGRKGANTIGAAAISNAGQDALVFGNASFANIQKEGDHLFNVVEYNSVYDFARAQDKNGNNITVTINPTAGFLFANLDATSSTINEEGQTVQTMKLARTISSETGEVTYEIKTKIIDNDPGLGSGVPTIMNGMTLIVEPTEQGLTITPIKEQHVMLFDADGKMIFSKHLTAEENVTLPTGVYIVRGEYEQVKAIKK